MAAELRRVGIAGTGAYAPEGVLTNADLEQMIDTSDEWITSRTGIKERRQVGEGEACSHLCVQAAEQAMEDAGVEPEEIDLVLVGTVTADYLLPSNAPLIQDRLGMTHAAAFDLAGACTGFVQGLVTGTQFIACGTYDNVLVIGAEALSRFVNYEDRNSCIIFGDGAGAVVLQPWETCRQGEVLKTTLGSDGSGWDLIWAPAGGSLAPMNEERLAAKEHMIHLKGREVFKFAVSRMCGVIEELMEGEDEPLGLVIPHQVNLRIIRAAQERLGLPDERIVVNIDRFGNTSAGSVPMAFDEARRDDRLVSGELVAMCAFGAGLNWGGALLRW